MKNDKIEHALLGGFMVSMVVLIGILAFCVPAYAQALLHVLNIPIVTTVEIDAQRSWATGFTIQNNAISGEDIVISRVEFFDKSGDPAKSVAFGFNQVVKPSARWSALLSDIIGKNRDGSVNVYIIAGPRAHYRAFASIFVDPLSFNLIEAKEVTQRTLDR